MSKKPLQQQLSVYLLQDSVKNFADALKRPDVWNGEEIDLDLGPDTEAKLYHKVNPGKSPKWMHFTPHSGGKV